jgi:hypothetical protein
MLYVKKDIILNHEYINKIVFRRIKLFLKSEFKNNLSHLFKYIKVLHIKNYEPLH